MKIRLIATILLSCFIASGALGVSTTHAQTILKPDIDELKNSSGLNSKPVSFSECNKNGTCGVEHIFVLANSLIKWLVGVSGAIALLMFVIGGIWMIFSGGNTTRVERGKDILIGSSVALVTILGSWVIVNFILTALGTRDEIPLERLVCGNQGDCPQGKVCLNSNCVEVCRREHADRAWDCRDLNKCPGVDTRDDCDTSPTCELNQCLTQPNNLDFVCCKI